MELLVSLHLPDEPAGIDLVLECDSADRIGDLAEALRAHAVGLGRPDPGAGLTVAVAGAPGPLDPGSTVVDSGLVSGQTVALVRAPPNGTTATAAAAGDRHQVSVDIAAGPAAGRFTLLGPGTHWLGRAPGCALSVDDPTLSRHHLALEIGPDLAVQLNPNPEAANGTYLGELPVTGQVELPPGALVMAGATAFSVRRITPDETRQRDRLGQIPYNRVPYRRSMVVPRPFAPVAAPPEAVEPRKLPIGAALLPLVLGVGMALVLGQIFFLVFALMSPVMLVYRHLSGGKAKKGRYARGRDTFLQRVEARAVEVAIALEEERAERHRAAPDTAELARQARFHESRLWERNREAADFLRLRLGLGSATSAVSAPVERHGDPTLRAWADERLAFSATVAPVPVTAGLAELGAVGLYGPFGLVTGVGTALVLQAACLHSPEDLVLAAGIGTDRRPALEWLKWLPHSRSSTSPVEGNHLAVGAEATDALLGRLLAVAARRLERAAPGRVVEWPRILLVLDEQALPDRSLLSQLLDAGPAAGIHTLWLGDTQYQLPRQCHGTLACADPVLAAHSRLRFTDPDEPDRDVEVEPVATATAMATARDLAPIRDASAASTTTAIPRRVTLLDAIGLPRPTGPELARRWAQPRPYGLTAALGVGADGTFWLDLVEQGPHALVAGTSGSGKSELLQSLVAALASESPPSRLSFLFVDYKGGAGSAELRGLPHTVGSVTNLDSRLAMRALTSLRAELQRRMALLEGRAKDLREMLEVDPAAAPPSLVIVCDEFATLVKEIPDFVAGIVDIAQRGRSLGIHLLLATQRPSGAVNENILANTNLRICLRVLDTSDSTSVIGVRDAADIPVPLRGRAYVRSGPGATSAFQCAWSGAPFSPERSERPVLVRPFFFGDGGGQAVGPDRTGGEQPAGPSELEVVVAAAADAARALRLPAPRQPWLPPLAEVVALEDLLADARLTESLCADPGRRVVLGLVDQPEHQAQHPAVIDLEATGGLFVLGTGGAGKTTVLRTIAAGVARQGGADGVVVHALDFASRALGQLAVLPPTGAVVPGDDLEQVARLLTLLTEEIARRREVLASENADTLSALRARHGGPVVPRILLLVDSYSGMHTALDTPETHSWLLTFHRIVAEGRQVGIHVVLTSERRNLPPPLLAAIGARLGLRTAEPEDLTFVGVPLKQAKEADLPAGRGFLDGAEVQVAVAGGQPDGASQAAALTELGAAARAAGCAAADPLPELPEVVMLDVTPTGHGRAPLGLVDLTLEVAEVDLSRRHLVVAGPPMSGRSTALATVAGGLRAGSPDLYLAAIGAAASPLGGLGLWDGAGFGRVHQQAVVEALLERFVNDDDAAARAVLVVDGAEDVEAPVAKLLERLVRLDCVRLAVSGDPGTFIKGFGGWLGELRRLRSVVHLQPESRSEIEQLAGVRARFRPQQPFPPGRAVLAADRGWRLVHIASPPVGTAPQ